MTFRGLFVSGDGRLRAPWRIAIFLLVFFILGAIIAVALRTPMYAFEQWTGIKNSGGELVVLMAALGAHAVVLGWVDRRPLSYVWLGREARQPRIVGYGFVLGAVPIAAASLGLLAMHWLSVQPTPAGSWFAAALKISLMLAPAALFEELVSRGYVLAALRDWVGMPAAVLVTSVAFGMLHLLNPGASAQPIILVTLAGIFLAVVLLATKSLYAAWSAHFAWNWVMAVPLHVSVSGEAMPQPGYRTVDTGPDWATGGPWGPEGGVFAAVAMVLAMAWLYQRSKNAQRITQNA